MQVLDIVLACNGDPLYGNALFPVEPDRILVQIDKSLLRISAKFIKPGKKYFPDLIVNDLFNLQVRPDCLPLRVLHLIRNSHNLERHRLRVNLVNIQRILVQ